MTGEWPLLAVLEIEALAQPGWLWVAVVALGAWWLAARAAQPTLQWSAFPQLVAAGARRWDLQRAMALGLRGGALIALCVALASPLAVHRLPPEPGYGLDLVLVVDASGSMRALDTEVGGQWRTRLELAREVVARFAEQRAAEGDRVALVVFGESAFTQCPLTSDGALLEAALRRVEAGVAGEATALGDALALAVKRARGGRDPGDGGRSAGRVVVLLTDGRNNAGSISVELATALATTEGIRVHTVAIGSAGGEVAMAPTAGASQRLSFERVDIDTDTLQHIAEATGGRFFAARRSRDLAAIYADIDALERIARPLPPRVHRSQRPEPMLGLAGLFLAAEIVTVRVLRRRLP